MITIINAGFAHGYSGNDHLIKGDECESVIGCEYHSVRDARRAAEREGEENQDECGGRVKWWAPVELEVQFASGEIRRT